MKFMQFFADLAFIAVKSEKSGTKQKSWKIPQALLNIYMIFEI